MESLYYSITEKLLWKKHMILHKEVYVLYFWNAHGDIWYKTDLIVT